MTIYKNPSEMAVINYKDCDGNRKRISTGLKYTTENIKRIKKEIFPTLLTKIEAEKAKKAKIFQVKANYTFEEVVDLFLEEKTSSSLRRYTIKDYETILRTRFIPIFGNRDITEITADDIQKYFVKQRKKFSAKTLANYKNPLNQVFKKAIRMQLIQFNPFNSLDSSIFNYKQQTMTKHMSLNEKKEFVENNSSIDPFNETEVLKLIDTAEGSFKNFIALLYFTALRPSEMVYLEWKNVNFEENYLFVEGAITGKQTKEEEDFTKTVSSRRTVYLSNIAMSYMKDQFKRTGVYESGVFLNQYGNKYSNAKSLSNNDWAKLFDRPRAKAMKNHVKHNLGIRHRDMYNLRHSFASINLSTNRLTLLFVSKQMGHSNAETTLRKYSSYVIHDSNLTLEMLNKSVEHI